MKSTIVLDQVHPDPSKRYDLEKEIVSRLPEGAKLVSAEEIKQLLNT